MKKENKNPLTNKVCILKIICAALTIASIVSIIAIIVLTHSTKEKPTEQPTEITTIDPLNSLTTVDGIVYTYDTQNKGLIIFDYTGNATEVIIPNEIAGYPVITIGPTAFSGSTNLTSITIPESVTTIGTYAFANCSNLQTITCMSTSISPNITIFGTGIYNDGEIFAGSNFTPPKTVYSPSGSAFTDLANKLKCTVLNLDGEPIPLTPATTEVDED